MPSSLVKFSHSATKSGDQNVFWNRVHQDGLPFRGHHAPMMGEEEYEAKTVRVADYRNAFFDVFDPASNKQFLEIMERCYNQWFQLVHLERFWVDQHGNRTHYHYVEWAEYYLEDGTRTPFGSTITELLHGQQNVGFHP